MAAIVLATFNARYAHASLGLRCLRAALGPLHDESALVELTLEERAADVAERILALEPRVLGLGVYVWNARACYELTTVLKRVRPELVIVLGGPEVSHDARELPIVRLADYVVSGEGELAFADLARRLLCGERPPERFIEAPPVDLATVPMPYDEYDPTDLAERTVYVESSRGCPFGCEFCLSSLDRHVRRVPTERFLAELGRLWERGLRHFRFVDRSFNLGGDASRRILRFFLDRVCPELFVHVEVVPDRLGDDLVSIIGCFPPGALQLELGVQTLDDAVAAGIGRQQRGAVVADVLRRLRAETGVHLHADLIAGLPGEGLDALAASFDRLVALGPHEVQVGILKRLRGAPIARHDDTCGMVYASEPPYELLRSHAVDFATLQRTKRLARYWDLVVNSGQLPSTAALLYEGPSAFRAFLAFSDWLFARTSRTHGIALERLVRYVGEYLTTERGLDAGEVRARLSRDWERGGRRRPLPVRGPAADDRETQRRPAAGSGRLPPRQDRRHR